MIYNLVKVKYYESIGELNVLRCRAGRRRHVCAGGGGGWGAHTQRAGAGRRGCALASARASRHQVGQAPAALGARPALAAHHLHKVTHLVTSSHHSEKKYLLTNSHQSEKGHLLTNIRRKRDTFTD